MCTDPLEPSIDGRDPWMDVREPCTDALEPCADFDSSFLRLSAISVGWCREGEGLGMTVNSERRLMPRAVCGSFSSTERLGR